MGSIVLKNIMLQDSSSADIVVADGVIREIRPAGAGLDDAFGDGAEVLDCTGKLALPGFVNMHTHAAMSLMRGLEEDVLFHRWLDRIWEVESRIDPEFVYWGTKVACIEMLRTGTTTCNNHYWFAGTAYEAASGTGIRPVESYVFLDKFDSYEGAVHQDV